MARYLITSALPYINGIKHLGNLAGSMLPADVYARFRRLLGDDVLLLCATDEHGTPAELAASKAGQDIAQYCRCQHILQKKAGDRFALSFDWFGRSSNSSNHLLTQHLARILENNGYIEERTCEQVFSPQDNRFLPDRYIEGTCPHCNHQPARGDQCDQCGRLLDPVDLLSPRSTLSGDTHLQIRQTKHLYLLQSKLAHRLRTWIDNNEHWPALALSIARKWLDEGLKDRAITRDLNWGVPVAHNNTARKGFENKVFYVWFDAPIAYIAAAVDWAQTKNNSDALWKSWWRTDHGADNVTYVQFMGKDNVAFHTVGFPATLIGSGEPWKLVDRLKAFNWVTWYGGKFSTSSGRGLFMDQALDLLPADCWRWCLIANAPESTDWDFTWEELAIAVNSDLANVLGNLVNRITRFCISKFDAQIPHGGIDTSLEIEHIRTALDHVAKAHAHFEDMSFRKAAASVRAVWATGNEYLTAAAPWTALRTDPERAAVAVRTGLNMAALAALVAQPILPTSSERILDALGVDHHKRCWPDHTDEHLSFLRPRASISSLPVLFSKISDDDIAAWSTRFGGSADHNQSDSPNN